jgi:hypothetical protein
MLLNGPLPVDTADTLRIKGWLPWVSKIIETDINVEAHLETLGLDIDAVHKSLGPTPQPCLLFTKHRFSDGSAVYVKEGFIACASSHWSERFPGVSREVLFGLHVLKFNLNLRRNAGEFRCDVLGCLSSDDYDANSFSLCEACQRSLLELNVDVVPVSLALEKLFREQTDVSGELFQQTPGYALSRFQVSSPLPAANVCITDKVIDWRASKGSDVRNWLSRTSTQVYANKDRIEKQYLSGPPIRRDYPLLIAARRWNSWTPALPFISGQERIKALTDSKILRYRTGGGYFLSDGKASIAVDPGYGYLESLYQVHGITIRDLDAVIITHDHPDHSAELNNILTLRFQYREMMVGHPLLVFMNASSFYLYKHLLEYHKAILHEAGPVRMEPNGTYTISDFTIKTVAVEHEEILDSCTRDVIGAAGPSEALGLSIQGTSDHVANRTFKISIVGDTSFPRDRAKAQALLDTLGKPDVVAVHLGSIEKEWANNPSSDASKIDYGRGKRDKGKHLGINGCAKMIALLQPRVAIITEFGEELDSDSNRRTVTDIIREFSRCSMPVVLPSDIGLSIALVDNKILGRCMECGRYVPAEILQVTERKGYLWYAYDAGCASSLHHYTL